MGTQLDTLTLSAGQVDTLAAQAGVSEDAIRSVAPALDEKPLWRRAISEVRTVYRQTPEQVRSNLVGLACEGVSGQITSPEQLAQNVRQRFQVATQEELTQLVTAVLGLWQSLYDASNSDDPDAQAAAVITCFTVEQLAG